MISFVIIPPSFPNIPPMLTALKVLKMYDHVLHAGGGGGGHLPTPNENDSQMRILLKR